MKSGLLMIIIFVVACSFMGINYKNHQLHSLKPFEKAGHKREVIRLYPNPSFDGKIRISTNMSDSLHFYIFDLEGTLINQTFLNNKEEKTITDLKKGSYIYDVFENDESIEEGKIIVK